MENETYTPKEYIRIRTNISARLPDPERKYRDSFDRTIEIMKFDLENNEAHMKESDEMLQETLDLISRLGGRVYSIKSEVIP